MSYALRPLLLCLLALLAVTGCEEAVTDAAKTERPYTLYGYLNPETAVQTVRVFPIQPLLEPVGPALDATVTFIDLAEGARFTATDSVIAFAGGEHAHVFNGHFRARYGSPYRVEVRRSDGATSTVDVTVPAEVAVEEQEVYTSRRGDRFLPLPHLPLYFRGMPTWIARAEAVYSVQILERSTVREIRIPYDARVDEAENGWMIDLDLAADYAYIVDRLAEEFGPSAGEFRLLFRRLLFEADVVNDGWFPPTGRFDAELLVEPGIMTNVENGFGFVGAGYEVLHQIFASECLLFWAGFHFDADPCTNANWCTYTGFRCDL